MIIILFTIARLCVFVCVCAPQLPRPADCTSEHPRHDHPEDQSLLPSEPLPRRLLEELADQGRPAALSGPPRQGSGGLLQVAQRPLRRYIKKMEC